MTKTAPDFNAVSFAHEPMHERLINWARWVRPRPTSWVHPMWKGFQSSNTQTGHGEGNIPLDPLDAQDIEKAVSALPKKQRFAVRWCYVYSGQPRKAAQQVGETLEGLYWLVVDGRQMLINRRALICRSSLVLS